MAALEHEVVVHPAEHHFSHVIGKTDPQQIKGTYARKGEFPRQGLYLVVKVEKGPLLVTGHNNSGGVAVVVRPGGLAVDFPDEVVHHHIGLVMGHGPGLGGGYVGGVPDDVNPVEILGL